jgi:hypothetical protein
MMFLFNQNKVECFIFLLLPGDCKRFLKLFGCHVGKKIQIVLTRCIVLLVFSVRQSKIKEIKKVYIRRLIMKWTGMYLAGYGIFIASVLAALWKLGILARIVVTWTLIGVVIAIGIGIMISVSSGTAKQNIKIDKK